MPSSKLALLMFVILFATTATTITTISTKINANYPDFQHLDVRKSIEETRINHPKVSKYDSDLFEDDKFTDDQNEGKWKLKLVHRDKILSSNYHQHRQSHGHLFGDRMQRDVRRVHSLVRRLAGNGSVSTSDTATARTTYKVEDFGSDVVSGMDQGSGEYFVRVGVGSPPKSQYMVIDSGSDIVWVQCQPCHQCYRQSDPVFDPAESASFSGISCGSSVCDRLENAGCHSGRCHYAVSYGDGSFTKGTLASETLTFGRAVVRNVAIGCGHRNRGMFVGAAGLLGLGGGPMSFVGQLGGQTGGAFSYCLLTRGTESSGSLEFGRGALSPDTAWIPLVMNSVVPTFYYIGLAGLGVGPARVPIPEDFFQLSELGDGGVVMDTGTAVTRFPTGAYMAFRDAFIAQTSNLPRAPSMSIFDTCYNLIGFVSVRVPTVSFYFSEGPVLTLPARNFLIPVDQAGTFCFAFAPSPTRLSIIGNIQQEGIQISFDGANGFVGFGPNVC